MSEITSEQFGELLTKLEWVAKAMQDLALAIQNLTAATRQEKHLPVPHPKPPAPQ